MTEPTARLKVRDVRGVTMVEFNDRKILDELCIQEIQDELARVVAPKPRIQLLLSFANVEYLSSAALGMLITLQKQVKEGKGALKLSDINPQIFEVFKITKLNQVFDIHQTADAALGGSGDKRRS